MDKDETGAGQGGTGQTTQTTPSGEAGGGFLMGQGQQADQQGQQAGQQEAQAQGQQSQQQPAGQQDQAGGFLSGQQQAPAQGQQAQGQQPQGQAAPPPAGGFKVPAVGAGAEEVAAFHQALGVPDTPAGYEVTLDQGLEGVIDLEAFKGLAHEVGLSPGQAQALVTLAAQKTQAQEAELAAQVEQQQAAQVEQTTGELKRAWGEAMTANLRVANRALRTFGGAELQERLAQAGMLNDPVVIHAFFKAGQGLREDAAPGSGTGASGTGAGKPSLVDTLYPETANTGGN